ncbi:MAG: toll/interleukin-1 receptor domain-containing protein [Roseiarcus sp.]
MSASEPAAEKSPFDVFISYANADKTTADAVCATLEGSGIRCWIAPRDIVPGSDWSAAIVEALGRCRLLVLVFSANANESTQIRNEVVQAVSNGLPIVPFRIEATVPSKSLAYFMGGVHWLDALTPPLEAHIQTLVMTVRTLLGAERSELRAPGFGANAQPTAGAAPSVRFAFKPAWRAGLWPTVALVTVVGIAASGAVYWLSGERHAESSRHTILVFNLPTEQDLARIREIAAQHALILPELAYRAPSGNIDSGALRFIGVWSSEIGYNGTGRQAMLIVTTVSADMRAEGYVLNGPPTAHVYEPSVGASTLPFHGEIDGDTLVVNPENSKFTYTAKLSLQADAITLISNRPDGKLATVVLKPVWRLANGA